VILQALIPEGRRLLTREFLHGEHPRWSDEECQDVVAPLERPVALEDFIAALPRRLPRNKAEIDGEVAVAIHQSLPLYRREAADPGVWRYLAIVTAPEFIRRRWKADEDTFRARFWRPGTRPDSNYYSRLWWIAELTTGKDRDYARTRKALASQALANAIFVRNFSHYFPAVMACLAVLGDVQGETVHRVVLELNRELALLPREALTTEDIAEILRNELSRGSALERSPRRP
jgi:hypothetical protein